jgi:hypothetical protein
MTRCSVNYGLWMVLAAMTALVRPQAASAEVVKSAVLETNVAYLRIAQTDKNLSDEVMSALGDLQATNPIAGVVLDLRFATGAASDDVKPTEAQLERAKLPLAILVNEETSGAATSLAEDLRGANAGLVFGGTTGTLQPDIAISVSAKDEKSFLENPYGALMDGDTNAESNTNLLPFVDLDHTSEADLVRDKVKDGEQNDSNRTTEPQKPFIRDPVLAHGVDFIKGLAALHISKS